MPSKESFFKIIILLIFFYLYLYYFHHLDYLNSNEKVRTESIINRVYLPSFKLSSKQLEIIKLENELFSNCSSVKKSDPDSGQLLYLDYIKHVRNYRINRNEFCDENPGLTAIIFVWSRVNGFQQREAIRHTWAQSLYRKKSSIKVLFVLGSTHNKKFQSRVEFENSKYEDILQFEFTDSYHNCTLKSIGVLRWTLFFCPNIKFLMKSDDDILVNTENLKNFVNKYKDTKQTIFGVKAVNWDVFRTRKSKWFISRRTYPFPQWPDFIVAAHLMTSDCVMDLYQKCLEKLPAIILEDVYITGILAQNTSIRLVDEKGFIRRYHYHHDHFDIIKKTLNFELFNQSISIGHGFKAQDYYRFWTTVTHF